MKKMLSLVMLLALVSCSKNTVDPKIKVVDGKNAAEWCYEEIKTKTDANIEHWTTQDLKSNEETKTQFNYLITTWHSNSGYPVRIEWDCNVSFSGEGTNETVYPKSAITYINVERLCVIEGRK